MTERCRFRDDPTHVCRRNTGQAMRPGDHGVCFYEAAAQLRDAARIGRRVNALFGHLVEKEAS